MICFSLIRPQVFRENQLTQNHERWKADWEELNGKNFEFVIEYQGKSFPSGLTLGK